MILDASVMAKWFLADETLVREALAVRSAAVNGDLQLAAPSILWSEAIQALVRAQRRGRVTSPEARALVDIIETSRPLITVVDVGLSASVRIALDVGVSAYDAQYLACAAQLQRTVLTADRGLCERGLAAGFDVAWLGDMPAASSLSSIAP